MLRIAPRGLATVTDACNESHRPCVPEFPTPAEASGKLVGWAGNPTKGGLSNGLGPDTRREERRGAATEPPTADGGTRGLWQMGVGYANGGLLWVSHRASIRDNDQAGWRSVR